MFLIPLVEFLGILRLEEDSTDSGYTFHGRFLFRESQGWGLVSTSVFGTTAAGPAALGIAGTAGWTGALVRAKARSSHLPKIIFPAVVCRTDVTETSIVFPIILRALSTTTMVPSSR